MADIRSFSISGDDGPQRKESIAVEDLSHFAQVDASVAAEAARATHAETSMTLMQGIKTYPKAIGWSVLLSTCIIVSWNEIWVRYTRDSEADDHAYRWRGLTSCSSTLLWHFRHSKCVSASHPLMAATKSALPGNLDCPMARWSEKF